MKSNGRIEVRDMLESDLGASCYQRIKDNNLYSLKESFELYGARQKQNTNLFWTLQDLSNDWAEYPEFYWVLEKTQDASFWISINMAFPAYKKQS